MAENEHTITPASVLRWVSGVSSALLVPIMLGLFNSVNSVKESNIRMEGKFDVLDMRLREYERTAERNEKRIEYLEQHSRNGNGKK